MTMYGTLFVVIAVLSRIDDSFLRVIAVVCGIIAVVSMALATEPARLPVRFGAVATVLVTLWAVGIWP